MSRLGFWGAWAIDRPSLRLIRLGTGLALVGLGWGLGLDGAIATAPGVQTFSQPRPSQRRPSQGDQSQPQAQPQSPQPIDRLDRLAQAETLDPEPPGLCWDALPDAIDQVIDRSQLRRAQWGIVVERLGQADRPLVNQAGDRFFIPASNEKLLTTAAALVTLGPDFRVTTTVRAIDRSPLPARPADHQERQERHENPEAQPADHPGWQTRGLVLTVASDPTLTGESLDSLARSVAATGLRRVDRLILAPADRSPGPSPIPAGWEWDDLGWDYAPPITAAIVDRNRLSLRVQVSPDRAATSGQTEPNQPVMTWQEPIAADQWQLVNRSQVTPPGSPTNLRLDRDWSQPILTLSGTIAADHDPVVLTVALRDPARYLLARWRSALTAAGIAIEPASPATSADRANHQTSQTDQTNNADRLTTPILAQISSPPLAELLGRTNIPSDNLLAETLLRWLGQAAIDPQPIGTIDQPAQPGLATAIPSDPRRAGLDRLRTSLARLGVDPTALRAVDGSGLGRQNAVTPRALVQLLQAMAASPYANVFRDSLPIAGQTGTLADRFAAPSPLYGRLRAKTGTLSGVSALSGYWPNPDLGPLAVAILVNQGDRPGRDLRQAIDAIALLIAQARSCR